MRLFAWAVLAAAAYPAMALAAPQTSTLAQPAARPASGDETAASVRLAMRQETLPPGGRLPEHRQTGERYLYVVAGRLKVSDLVTGEEQVVEAGRMAVEQPGDWHVAVALGEQPTTFYVIDRGPADAPAATADNHGN